MNKFVVMALLLAAFVGTAAAPSIGATPSLRDFGSINRGGSKEVTFYITSDAQNTFTLNPIAQPVGQSTLMNNAPDKDMVSEQDVSDWIKFSKDTYTINPDTTETYTLPGGAKVEAQGTINVTVNVPFLPGQAEPGFHMAQIRLNPDFGVGEGGGFGAAAIGLSVPRVMFTVPGNARREIQLNNAEALRVGPDRVQVILQFQNTGTVTTSFENTNLPIYQDGRRVGQLNVDNMKLAPGETQEMSLFWTPSDLEGGTYRLEGTVDYTSGQFLIDGTIAFTDTPQPVRQVEQPSGDGEGEKGSVPLWLFALFVVALAAVLYTFEVSLFWMMLIIGGVSIAFFILTTSASNFLLLVLLTSFVGIIYYGGL
ncbi:MAG: CARDB domain-containing protein [Candidatus Nanohaloarchaea archaeon]